MSPRTADPAQPTSVVDVSALHAQLAALGEVIPDAERKKNEIGRGTTRAIAAFQTAQGIAATGVLEASTLHLIEQAVVRITYSVSGRVFSPDRAGVGGLVIHIVDKDVGPDTTLATATTDARGRYRSTFTATSLYTRKKRSPDLQAQAYAGDTRVGVSAIRYNAGVRETLDVVVPASCAALPSEHETLTSAIGAVYSGALTDLVESAERRDITYLGNKTGWDARAVALAALAEQFSGGAKAHADAVGKSTLPPALYYALLRAGVPADPVQLYRVDAARAQKVWTNAIQDGVIPASLEASLPQAVETFRTLSAHYALDSRAPVGVSTLGELLGLTLANDKQRTSEFIDLYTHYRADPVRLWKAVDKAFGAATTKRLQLDGQLAFLTLDNASVIAALHAKSNGKALTSAIDLVSRGYYAADAWKPLLKDQIPASVPGSSDAERRANYAELLATNVRLSYPTAVVAAMVSKDALPLKVEGGTRNAVSAFLNTHQADFVIGMTPVDRYIAEKGIKDVSPEVVHQIKRLQRTYQIAPSDAAMAVLLDAQLDSAHAIVRYDERRFVNTFSVHFGGDDTAHQVYVRARQIHNTVLNVVTGYITLRRQPHLAIIGGTSPAPGGGGGGGGAAPNDIGPTLESIFGSMDYCDCGECGTILGAAAYLVDLLSFLDVPMTGGQASPLDVLRARRPDIENLPLTCENTNTALPYIDIVNEILEYFIGHNENIAGYPGWDTGTAVTSAELIANPQHVLDDAQHPAYTKLAQANFPPPLPFDRSLELTRRHLSALDVRLADAMATMREGDVLERPAGSYGWRDILMEELGLSREQYALLDTSGTSLADLFGFAPGTADGTVQTSLANVKTFSRRIGITYQDLADVLQTRFVNPDSSLLPALTRLGVSFSDIAAVHDGTLAAADFRNLVNPGIDFTDYDNDPAAWVTDPTRYQRIMRLLTIFVPPGSTSATAFASLQLRYADPAKANTDPGKLDFVRLLRFVRLQKALGWTIPQTDAAIAALYPAAHLPDPAATDAANLQSLDAGFDILLPRLGVLSRLMRRLGLSVDDDSSALLACWAPLDTTGTRSLYARMFLTPTLIQNDDAFADDGYGKVPGKSADSLLAHADSLRAAFGITADELTLIANALSFTQATQLTLSNITDVFRRAWLARTLGISVQELLLLTSLTGINPFDTLDPPDTAQGRPNQPGIVRLLDLLDAVRGSGLEPSAVLYLFWNKDLSGVSAPTADTVLQFVRKLRSAFANVESSFTVVDDPNGDVARARMALVYGGATTDFFFGLINGSFRVDTSYSAPAAKLDPAIVTAGGGALLYDDFRKQLSYVGVMSTGVLTALKTVPGVPADFKAAVDALYAADQAAIGRYFAQFPELNAAYTTYMASASTPDVKRTALLAGILPVLIKRREEEQALATIGSAAAVTDDVTSALMSDHTALHSATAAGGSAVADLTALKQAGLSASFYWSAAAPAGVANQIVAAAPSLAYGAAPLDALPANPQPGAKVTGVWKGYLEVPQDGNYNFRITTDAGATIALTIGGSAIVMAPSGTTWTNNQAIALVSGTLIPVTITAQAVGTSFVVEWETVGIGWQTIPARYLYSDILVATAQDTYTRFFKLVSIRSALGITPNELVWLGRQQNYTSVLDGLNAIPVTAVSSGATAAALGERVKRFADFGVLKKALSPKDERLLDVLKNPTAALTNGASALLTLTAWDDASVTDALTRLGYGSRASLSSIDAFRRVQEMQRLSKKTGVAVSSLNAGVTNAPTASAVVAFQSALRARYATADWLAVVQPINDAMRSRQRTALVAYVLQALSQDPQRSAYDTPDKLFEMLLVDVGMEPCMLTSRIRLALSSVQLFIERCLMNLEPDVSPDLLSAERWTWMKRFRVWQANRKVFLWPENWLEPELRDDQSPFFKDAIGGLLQGDITDDAAASALTTYLGQLEEVAKLEVCGFYFDDSMDGNLARQVGHVIARTQGAHRKYFYRRVDASWSPWEPVKLDIEEAPIIPVVWNQRLFLFWLRIVQESSVDPSDASSSGSSGDSDSGDSTDDSLSAQTADSLRSSSESQAADTTMTNVSAILCWSERYDGKWQPAKTSEPAHAALLTTSMALGSKAFDRSTLRLGFTVDDDGLRIDVSGEGSCSFLMYNTHSDPVPQAWQEPGFWRSVTVANDEVTASYDGGFDSVVCNIIDATDSAAALGVVEARAKLRDSTDAPFFVQDRRHAFYVTTNATQRLLRTSNGFGHVSIPVGILENMPYVVLGTGPGDPGDPMQAAFGRTPGFGVTDPVPMENYLTNNATIRFGLATAAGVTYGKEQLGPSGPLNDKTSSF